MFGSRWTDDQKRAYRSAFTIGRIVDELGIVLGVAWLAAWIVAVDWIAWPWNGALMLSGLALLGLGATRYLPVAVWVSMPPELRESMVDDRFAGVSSPRAPRTYRELMRRWLAR